MPSPTVSIMSGSASTTTYVSAAAKATATAASVSSARVARSPSFTGRSRVDHGRRHHGAVTMVLLP